MDMMDEPETVELYEGDNKFSRYVDTGDPNHPIPPGLEGPYVAEHRPLQVRDQQRRT